MDTIETHTITRTLRFRTSTLRHDEVTAWLKVTGGTERIIGQYYASAPTRRTREGGGWVAHADTNASVPLPNVDEETWRNAVRLVHLYR